MMEKIIYIILVIYGVENIFKNFEKNKEGKMVVLLVFICFGIKFIGKMCIFGIVDKKMDL